MKKKRIGKILLGVVGVAAVVAAGVGIWHKWEQISILHELENLDEDCEYEDEEKMDEDIMAEEEQQDVNYEEVVQKETEESSYKELS